MRRDEIAQNVQRLADGEYLLLLISRRPLRRALPLRVREERQRWTLRDVRTGELFGPLESSPILDSDLWDRGHGETRSTSKEQVRRRP